MSNQFWVSNPNSPSQGAGAALASSTTMTDISPLPQWSVPYYLYAGQRIRLNAYGIFSTTGTQPLTFAVYWGGAATGTALATAAVTTGSTAASWPWTLSYNFNVRSIGTTGAIWGQGKVDVGTSLTAFTGVALPSATASSVTINSTTLQIVTIAAQWGTNSASNTITLEDYIPELLN